MADNQHLNLLISGVKQWNQWRSDNPNVTIDLSNAELSEFNFRGFNLNNVNLSRANLTRAIFFKTILSQVNLESSNLSSAKIITNLDNVDLSQATLNDTVLINLPNGGNEKNALLRQKESILQQLIGLGNQKWDIDRVIWRAGELKIKEATPLLVKLIGTGKPLRDYCIVWALGWCGDTTVIPHLQSLLGNPQQPDFVHRIAFEAILKLADTQTQNQLRLAQINQLPQSLKTIVKKGNSGKLIQKLQEYLTTEGADFNVINTLYQIDNNIVRPALINFFKTAPFAQNYFRQIRQIFKIAEYRLDAEVLGILTYRFEKELTNEIYSQKSKTYLQKRIWRTLKELAEKEIILHEQHEPDLYKSDYVLIATEILLSYDDEDAEQIRNTGKGRLYDVYARYLIFNHILYENSHRYILKPNNKAWQCQSDYQIESPPPRVREEAFPELWSANPNMLVRLLSESNCQPVHHFAVTALRDCSEFLLHIQVNNIIKFLAKSYQETQEFALELARILYNSQQPNLELLTALINCDLEIARNLVLDWVSQQPKYFLSQPQFIVNLLVSPYLNIRSFVKNLIKSTRLTDSKKIALVNEIIGKLITFELNNSEIAIELLNLLLEDFTKYLERLPMNLIRGLVASNINELRDLGISIFIKLPENIIIQDFQIVVETKNNLSPDNFNDNHNNSILSLIIAYQDLVIYDKIKPTLIKIGKKHSDFIITLVSYIFDNYEQVIPQEFAIILLDKCIKSIEVIPFNLLEKIINSHHQNIVIYGISILNKLPDSVLIQHPKIILTIAQNCELEVRNQAKPIIVKLANKNHHFFFDLITNIITDAKEITTFEFVLELVESVNISVAKYPFSIINSLLYSDYESIELRGINLFTQLSDNIILEHGQVFLDLINYNKTNLNNALQPIITRLANKNYPFFFDLIINIITNVREIKTFEFILKLIESVNISVAEYPFSIINSLLYSGYESIQLRGINLFAQLSDDVILEHEQVFLDLINYNKTNLNNALQTIITRLASEYNDFVIKLIKELIIKFSEEDIKILVLNLLRTIAFPANESTFNLMEFLLASNQKELKVTAVNIFEKLPDDTLLKHQNIFIELITNDSTIVLDAMSSFLKKFINKYCQFVIEIIEKLLSKESTEKSQLLVANLLLKITDLSNADGKDTQNEGSREMDSLNNPDFLVTYIPFHIIEFLVNSQYETVTKIGIDIFAQLPPQIIIQHQSIVAKFIVHKNHIFRESIQNAIAQAGNNLYFILQTIPPLIKLLVKKETFTGIHEYIISILKGSLSESIFYISKIDTDKLIKSNYKLAQELGSLSLENNYQKFVKEYEIKEIIILANHELLNVRQVAWKMMELKLYRIRKNHQDKLAAVRLLESSWDDSRQFARDLFSNNFNEEDWTADVMITICDSIKEDVRTFGKELVKQYFRDARGKEYLLKFSEHPSADIQLLATDYLNDFASDNEENLAQLEPYFNTILSQVNKGRTAKNKVFEFLLKEAEKNEYSARMIADILNRQSVTMAITDKAKIIQIMMKIKKRYPTITLPLEVKQVSEIRS